MHKLSLSPKAIKVAPMLPRPKPILLSGKVQVPQDNFELIPVSLEPQFLDRNPIGGGIKWTKGSKRSVARLRDLNFDPITELVRSHERLEQEIQYQERLRNQTTFEMKQDGEPRAYRAEIHHALFDKQTKIEMELLRYGYGRVPEVTVLETKKHVPLIVNLTKKGETYIANDLSVDNDDQDEQW